MKYLVLSITKPFEHILLIVVGDLLQLQPVGGRPVYANYRNYSKMFDLFWGYFKIIELTDLIRHKRDDTSVDLLNNVRIARPQSNYLKLL